MKINNTLDAHKNKKMRYQVENPHMFSVNIIDNLAPEGAKIVYHKNDKMYLTEAKNKCDAMNHNWHIKKGNEFLNS